MGCQHPTEPKVITMPRELLRELSYDHKEMAKIVEESESTLTPDQQAVYNQIVQAVESSYSSLLFLDAPGGTGKTFVTNRLLARIRAQGNIALAVASSNLLILKITGSFFSSTSFRSGL